jgi:hypothetical protein
MSAPQPDSGAKHWVTRHGLRVQTTLDSNGPLLATFYAGYDRSFVLPNEKEELQGFADCLALNFGSEYARLAELYGPYREVVLLASDAEDASVGGANFIVAPIQGQLCLNLNYLFVLPEQRRKGHFAPLVHAVREAAHAYFPGHPREPLVFIEQNDPLRMSAQEYAEDTGHTGLDQLARIAIWAKFGARILDFPYVQPALSKAQAADPNLVYSVLGAAANSLDACVLRAHLERFFAISVLKGQSLENSPEAQHQLAALSDDCAQHKSVPLLDPTAALQQLQQHSPSMNSGQSLRAVVRAIVPV